ncbi:MAG: helix-turn-helix domain-containing protein [Clostridia bacterium]|nr:helix-turn-helix domain-containing protein [Clostridia bacterium]
MEDIKFNSSLSQQEIEDNFADFNLFESLVESLTEALAHSRGKAAAETFSRKRSLPDVNVAEIRGTLNMTQRSFASMLGVSSRTVESWEAGKTTPSPTAKKLLYLIQKDHQLAQRLMEA